jgi:hypothetical protein
MSFDLDRYLEVLERTPATLRAMLGGLSDEWTSGNEGPDTWSPYDVLGHLIHGENTDWMARLDIILSDADDKTFVPFDRFAQFEESRGKTIADLLHEFERLREANVARIRGLDLTDVQLDRTGTHPEFGAVTLRQLLSTWTVHDLDHIVQIARVMAAQVGDEVGPWKAYIRVLKEKVS